MPTCYLAYDGVGSVRLVTNQSGAIVARHDYLPFGGEIPNGTAGRNGNFGSPSNIAQGFTGQEADGGTATLDFFNARYMAGVLGAFTQPDPMSAGADFINPQSWNAYGYVLGNPLGLVDPSGMDCIKLESGGTADDGQGNACPGSGDPSILNVYSGGSAIAVSFGYYGYQNQSGSSGSGGGSASGGGGNGASNQGSPTNGAVCSGAANAPSPSWYAAKGSLASAVTNSYDPYHMSSAAGGLISVTDLANFRGGGPLDAQVQGASRPYGNYVFGAYMRAAGFSLSDALSGANSFAAMSNASYPKDLLKNANYPAIPANNVDAITLGYNDQSNGTLCHK